MRQRRLAREFALQILYQKDLRKSESIDEISRNFWDRESAGAKRPSAAIKSFATVLIEGTLKNIETIDAAITKYAQNWHMNRMAVIDRNILRMSTFELFYIEDIPPKVTINEAIDIAKRFGDVESGKFVNGILDKINKKEGKRYAGKKS